MNKKRILFVYFHDLSSGNGGAKRAFQNLQGCLHCGCTDTWQTCGFMPSEAVADFVPNIKKCLFISPFECAKLAELINRRHYDIVFFDTSLYGEAVKYLREHCPQMKAVVHCHNFEKKYYEDQEKNGGSNPDSRFASECEAAALQAADRIIYISQNDLEEISECYGISSDRGILIPPALADGYQPCSCCETKEPYVLFFGSAFYANIEAARFLIREVAPHTEKKIVIAGSGMDCLAAEAAANTEILGYVPFPAELMNGACAFVSPVFSGSGAKVKTAEALMYGKYLIATEESLIGYNRAGMKLSVCRTAEEFARSISDADPSGTFYDENRVIFERDHSLHTQKKRYAFLEEM